MPKVTQLIIDRYKHLQKDKLVFGKMNYWSMCKKLKTVLTVVELHLHKPERTMLHGKVLDDFRTKSHFNTLNGRK